MSNIFLAKKILHLNFLFTWTRITFTLLLLTLLTDLKFYYLSSITFSFDLNLLQSCDSHKLHLKSKFYNIHHIHTFLTLTYISRNINFLHFFFSIFFSLLLFYFFRCSFGPTYSHQPKYVTHYCEDYLVLRGIDDAFANYIMLESVSKCTREKIHSIKGLLNFL